MKLWSTLTWVTRLLLLHHSGGKTHTFQEISHFLPAASQIFVPLVTVPDRRACYHVYSISGACKKLGDKEEVGLVHIWGDLWCDLGLLCCTSVSRGVINWADADRARAGARGRWEENLQLWCVSNCYDVPGGISSSWRLSDKKRRSVIHNSYESVICYCYNSMSYFSVCCLILLNNSLGLWQNHLLCSEKQTLLFCSRILRF